MYLAPGLSDTGDESCMAPPWASVAPRPSSRRQIIESSGESYSWEKSAATRRIADCPAGGSPSFSSPLAVTSTSYVRTIWWI